MKPACWQAGAESRKRKAFWQVTVWICFGLCALSFQPAKAQTFSEWFNQKSTLIKYLTTQIGYVMLYERELKQGYNTAKSGLNVIGGWKNGELGLHSDYYSSLGKVNPQVLAATDVGSIRTEALSIAAEFSGLNGLNGLSGEERAYVVSVGDGVTGNCNRDLEDLGKVLASGAWQMTDAERIARVKRVAAAVRDEYLFTCSFCGKVRLLVMQRNGDSQDSETLRRVYGVSQ